MAETREEVKALVASLVERREQVKWQLGVLRNEEADLDKQIRELYYKYKLHIPEEKQA